MFDVGGVDAKHPENLLGDARSIVPKAGAGGDGSGIEPDEGHIPTLASRAG